jgi:cytochrome c oxidase assembly protein subunit 15
MPRMVGGVKFEHSHRMIAGGVGILTIILALALWIKDSRRWVKWIGGAAVLAVLAQAGLGGITVLFHLPVTISTSHATLAQIFFCLTASLAFFTRADWRWDEPKLEDASTPSLQHLSVVTTGAILVQLILGAVYRHSGMGVEPHVVGACVITMLVVWVVARIIMKFSQARALLRSALWLATLLMLQLSLGMGAYLVKMAGRNAPQPLSTVVNMTTAHVAVGALVLVTSLYLTYQTYRFLTSPTTETKIASAPHGAAI